DVQIARRPAIDARLAIACGAYAHAIVDTGRNLDLQRFVLADAAHAVAGGARVGNLLARTMAGGAGLLHAENTLLHAHRAAAATGTAGLGLGTRFGARAVAGFAALPAGHADFGVEAGSSLL